MFTLTDQESRLLDMGHWFIAVQEGMVNLSDLCEMKGPGGIVRTRINPRECIAVFTGPDIPVGCVAGWVSED